MNINKRKYPTGRTVWRARYPDPTRGGKRQIERQFPTRREAEAWLTGQKEAVRRGDHADPRQADRLLSDLAEEWRSTWIDLEPKTIAGYRSILNHHVLPRWGQVRASAIDVASVQIWINELATDLHPRTVRHIYSVLRGVLKIGVERRYLQNNPCDSVRMPKVPASGSDERIVLSAAEVRDLAEAIDPRFRVLIYTAAYTGLRAGEIEALRKRDIDLLHGTLMVERSLKEIGGELIFGAPKTGKKRRVSLPRFLVRILELHLSNTGGGPDALVFTGAEGGAIRHHNFYRRYFRPAVTARRCQHCQETGRSVTLNECQSCGRTDFVHALPQEKHGLRFHDLRHTCASLLISAGAHPKAIQEHLGHRNIQTTLDVYGHLLPSAHEALAGALDQLHTASSGPFEAQLEGSARRAHG